MNDYFVIRHDPNGIMIRYWEKGNTELKALNAAEQLQRHLGKFYGAEFIAVHKDDARLALAIPLEKRTPIPSVL
jgi:hypothetical protein